MLDGLNRYMYVHGNPVRYVDPSGMLTDEHRAELEDLAASGVDDYGLTMARRYMEAQERAAIDTLVDEYEQLHQTAEETNSFRDWQAARRARREMLRRMGYYNRDIVPTSVRDYGGVRLTGGFEEYGDYWTRYRQLPHPGIDFVGPVVFTLWYTVLEAVSLSRDSNPFVLSVPGTAYRIRIKHVDSGAILTMQAQSSVRGGVSGPGQALVPFPRYANGCSRPHFHLEIRTTDPTAPSPLVDPIGLGAGTRRRYLYLYIDDNGRRHWDHMSYAW
jgi:hypothetical protein